MAQRVVTKRELFNIIDVTMAESGIQRAERIYGPILRRLFRPRNRFLLALKLERARDKKPQSKKGSKK